MAFSAFKTVEEVATAHQIALEFDEFIQAEPMSVDSRLLAELRFNLTHVAVRVSEAAACEFLIVPVLRAAWIPFSDSLNLWSRAPLGVTEPLVGLADYYFTKRSPLGLVPDLPVVIVVEAKRDDFQTGWGQCLRAMLAAQQMNGNSTTVIYGCVVTSNVWTFGKLVGKTLTQEPTGFTLRDVPVLMGAWHFVFTQAKEQAFASAA